MLKHFKLWINLYLTLFNPINSVQLSGEIYEACPYSNICNRTAERTFDVDGMVPCCSSCSCDEDCGLNLDCCFNHLDKYKLVEKGIVDCVTIKIRNGKNVLDNNERESFSYYMVQTCSGELRGDTGKLRELSNDCRLSDEFGNSLVVPVSSLESKSIYVNEKCAACNNLNNTRIKKWNYLFVPEDTTVAFHIGQQVVNKLGMKTYVPPIGENWTNKRCYNKYVEVESCNDSNIWQDLCDHLRAPFQSLRRNYKNVYCILCNGIQKKLLHKECESDNSRGLSSSSFSFLLTTDIEEDLKRSDRFAVTSMATSGNTCPTGYAEHVNSICLPIHCPEGMLKVEDGCSYLALKWYMAMIAMHFKLLPKQGPRLSISHLQSFGEVERTNPFTWLKLPCRKLNPTLMEVYYSTASLDSDWPESDNGTDNYVTSFIVRILKMVEMESGIDPSLTIPMFDKCVRKNWKAIIAKETYTFQANLDKHSWQIKNMVLLLRKWPSDKKYDFIARPVQYKFLARTPVSRRIPSASKTLELKKPFFCKQVRIPNSDVEIHFGEIRIISRNVTVGTNEYLVLEGDPGQRDGNKTTFSVCIDDYDASLTESSKNAIHAISSSIALIARIVPIIFLCISM